eukprot:CAMPEP_0183337342 /NCGR_PEP_ID=MMETSP0164_2-20130417/5015_1 /TAXON_ID=221442 /ORGANISM="Coccolithus pelagicus ssp braarudi, Strain PLY182g" /LENGTH=400 /DNA_ID=CAMNT_0025507013 /DNA_START=93 /DNA_END=1295 /DNA_ORIENTATION=+
MTEYLQRMNQVPRFAAAAHRPARRRLWGSERQSTVVRLVIGNAIGDAFGFGIEMQDAEWIRCAVKYFDRWPHNPVMSPELRRNNVRGFYSDDAEMTVGLMKALAIYGNKLDRDGMLRAWNDEWEISKRRPPPALPGVGRQGHGGIASVWSGDLTLDEMRQRQADRTDPGNAPPMRALPLGFLTAALDRERLSMENADATHPHPKARAASLLISFACRFLVVERGPQVDLISAAAALLEASVLSEAETLAHLRSLDGLADYHDFGERFCAMPREVHQLLCGPQPCPFTVEVPAGADGTKRMEGLFADAMRTAGAVLYLCKFQRGPLDVLKASVDLGGHVDSVAALCLGLVAAAGDLQFGEEGGLSWRLLEEVEGVEYLITHAKVFEAWLEQQQQMQQQAPG